MHEGHRERLRQTFLAQGADAFFDHQALELLLAYALPRCDTNALAHTLIQTFGSLQNVLTADVHDLMRIDGVGEKTAILLSLAGSLTRRVQQETPPGKRLATPAEAVRFCRSLFRAERYEAIHVISLDKSLRVLYCDKLSSGTLTETAVYPRLVVESALRHGAHSLLLTHNHPSGDPHPSKADIDATLLILRAVEPIGIKLHDHIIISRDGAFSMTRDALLTGGSLPEPAAAAAEREKV